MYKYSRRSQANLLSCHIKLQVIFNQVLQVMDCSVLSGSRTLEEQNRLYDDGKSQLKYPESSHNLYPSEAVDVAPYPIDWNDKNRFAQLAGVAKGIASMIGVNLSWGGDWEDFEDLGHFEIVTNN